jgi:hypothetical protein
MRFDARHALQEKFNWRQVAMADISIDLTFVFYDILFVWHF